MSKKININFEYAPHSAKAEDKKIRDWRGEYDPDCRKFTLWNILVVVGIPFFSMVFIVITLYLAMQIDWSDVSYILAWIDGLPPWFWCIFTGSCVMAIVLVWRGKKDRV